MCSVACASVSKRLCHHSFCAQLAAVQDNGTLQELCQSLLHALFQLLPRFGSRSSSDLRATVYSRCPASLESGSLQLQRIACWPAEHHAAHKDAMLGQHMPLYGRGCGVSAGSMEDEHRLVLHNAREGRGLGSSTEESLVQVGRPAGWYTLDLM